MQPDGGGFVIILNKVNKNERDVLILFNQLIYKPTGKLFYIFFVMIINYSLLLGRKP